MHVLFTWTIMFFVAVCCSDVMLCRPFSEAGASMCFKSRSDEMRRPAQSTGLQENVVHAEPNSNGSSHSRIRNSNQISTQWAGINVTLHLTLKWGRVVLVDYRWLIVGWRCSEMSPEIHLQSVHVFSPSRLFYLSVPPSASCCASLNIEHWFIQVNPHFLLVRTTFQKRPLWNNKVF